LGNHSNRDRGVGRPRAHVSSGSAAARLRLLAAAALAAGLAPLAAVAGATSYTYDAQGRLVCSATPDGYFTSYILDSADNRAQTVRNTTGCVAANQTQAPVANPFSTTVLENSTANWISLRVTGGTATSVGIVGSGAAHGTAAATGAQISYSPNSGYTGSDSFQYYAQNSAGVSPSATVSVTVASTVPGPPPVAHNVNATVLYGSTNNVIPSSITGGPALSVRVIQQPSYGQLSANGLSFLYSPTVMQPSDGHSTTDSFSYEASNFYGTSAPAGVAVTINPPTPVAGPVSATVGYNSGNTPLNLNVTGSYDHVIVPAPGPSHGTTTTNTTVLTYKPAAGYPSSGQSAPDSFQYQAKFGSMTSAPGTVSITVAGPPGGNQPVANPDTMTLQGQVFGGMGLATGCIDPTTNDTSPLGYTLTMTGVNAPQYSATFSSTSFSNGNQACYKSTYIGNFTDNFTYAISDGHGGVAVGTITVNVTYP
jgi:hypothetical protein